MKKKKRKKKLKENIGLELCSEVGISGASLHCTARCNSGSNQFGRMMTNLRAKSFQKIMEINFRSKISRYPRDIRCKLKKDSIVSNSRTEFSDQRQIS